MFALAMMAFNLAAGTACIVMTVLNWRAWKRYLAARTLLLHLCVQSWMIRPWAPPGAQHMAKIIRLGLGEEDDG